MTLPLILACLWVLVGAATAMLPLRKQMIPGLALLISAPILLVWIGRVHGWLWVVVCLLAIGSMMRNPLIYLYKRATGQEVHLPPEMRR